MNKSQTNLWWIAAKVVLFILALYLSYIILRPLLNVLIGISFWLIKIVIFFIVAFLVIHFFLKVIFNLDLFKYFNYK